MCVLPYWKVTPDDLLEQFTEPIHENGHIRGKGRRPSGILAYYVYSKEIDGVSIDAFAGIVVGIVLCNFAICSK